MDRKNRAKAGNDGTSGRRVTGEEPGTELEALRAARLQLEALLETSTDGIWIYDHAGRVINLSRASEEMCGLGREELLGRTVFELSARGLWNNAVVPEVLRTRRQRSDMSRLLRTGRDALVTGTPVLDEWGKLSFVVVNERDISQLKLLEEELKRARDVAEAYKGKMEELALLELGTGDIVAESEAMRNVLRMLHRLASMEASNILILGESGTGKGMLAKFYHACRGRDNAPFIQINCAALPESLLETELFGYERGAFTGAREQGKIGLFELANGGTLFLDEIGEMPLPLQSKLLIYLDNHEIMPLGGLKPKKVHCSVIAATNRDIEELAAHKTFRKDLLYRLNSFTIRIPPLRERPEDIFELSNVFLENYNQKYGVRRKLSIRGFSRLQNYAFPGNVRELQNLLKRAVVLGDKEYVDDIVIASLRREADAPPPPGRAGAGGLDAALARCERGLLTEALKRCRTTRELAEELRISQSTAVRKLKKHGLAAGAGSGGRRGRRKRRPD